MATIVLADDERDILAVTQRLLTRAGHEVVVAADGAAAWEAIQRVRPAIVVSDLDMPIMSGTDLCARIREHAETRGLPVIFISGSLMPGDTEAVAQATAVLRKPFLARELTSCVEKARQAGHVEGQEPTICP